MKRSHLIKQKNKLLPKGYLVIKINIKYSRLPQRPRPGCFELSKDFSTAFSDMMFSDFTIVCGEEKFECHAFVLAARSPVFKGMLDSNFKERVNMEMKIDLVTPEILKVLFFWHFFNENSSQISQIFDFFKSGLDLLSILKL